MSNDTNNTNLEQLIILIVNEKKPQSVEQLATYAREKIPITNQKIIAAIIKLKEQGKIILSEPPSQASQKTATRIKTVTGLWYPATIALATAAAAVVLLIPEGFYPWIYLRNTLGLVFVLWLPGYAFIKALFPTHVPIKTSKESLDNIERIALSIGVSLALVPMIGLLLYYTPLGINLLPIVLSLFVLTAILSTAAVMRERQIAQK